MLPIFMLPFFAGITPITLTYQQAVVDDGGGTIAYPISGVAAGDLLLMCTGIYDNNEPPTNNTNVTGWTQIVDFNSNSLAPGRADATRIEYFYRIADGTENGGSVSGWADDDAEEYWMLHYRPSVPISEVVLHDSDAVVGGGTGQLFPSNVQSLLSSETTAQLVIGCEVDGVKSMLSTLSQDRAQSDDNVRWHVFEYNPGDTYTNVTFTNSGTCSYDAALMAAVTILVR